MAPTQQPIRLEFRCEGVDTRAMQLVRIEGGGTISSLYKYQLTFHVQPEAGRGLDEDTIEDLLTKPCSVQYGEGAGLDLHGVLSEFVMLSCETERQPITYQAVLVPTMWKSTLSRRSCIYQDSTVGMILKEVLGRIGIRSGEGLLLDLFDSWYPTREYTVQYQETDFDFMNRLMEHYGLFYFFEQNPSAERLIISDNNRSLISLTDFSDIEYVAAHAGRVDPGVISKLDHRRAVRPKKVVTRDYNYRESGHFIETTATQRGKTATGEQQFYAEHFKTEAEGGRIAQVRVEALEVRQEYFTGETTVQGLKAGHRFSLVNHPMGLDQDLYVTEVSEVYAVAGLQGGELAGQGDEPAKRFVAVPLGVQYRKACETPRPRIRGHMHAVIDGDDNLKDTVAADLDESGRYAVLFPYDSFGTPGGRASRRIRMAQPTAGAGYGMHFPLRIGTEVIVTHVDGDPDRPVIAGAVPNPRTQSPVTGTTEVAGEGASPASPARDKGRGPTISRIQTASGITMSFYDDAQPDDIPN